MKKPKALDLFCGGGGAAEGLIDAGFEVIGVDVVFKHHKQYPGLFVQSDACRPPSTDNTEAAAAVADIPQLTYLPAPLRRRKAFANAAGAGRPPLIFDPGPGGDRKARPITDKVLSAVLGEHRAGAAGPLGGRAGQGRPGVAGRSRGGRAAPVGRPPLPH